MLADYILSAFFGLLGLLALTASLFNFNWYFQTSSASMFVKWLGRLGARLFYGMLGFLLIAIATYIFITTPGL